MATWIYLLQMEDSHLYKIGYTTQLNVHKRIGSIQTGCPVNLKIIDLIKLPTDVALVKKTEKAIHKKLKSYRQRGEWFLLEDLSVWHQAKVEVAPESLPSEKHLALCQRRLAIREECVGMTKRQAKKHRRQRETGYHTAQREKKKQEEAALGLASLKSH